MRNSEKDKRIAELEAMLESKERRIDRLEGYLGILAARLEVLGHPIGLSRYSDGSRYMDSLKNRDDK